MCHATSTVFAQPLRPPEVMPLMGNLPIWNANTSSRMMASALVGTVLIIIMIVEEIVSNFPPGRMPARSPSHPPSSEEITMAGTASSSVHCMRNSTVSSTGVLMR